MQTDESTPRQALRRAAGLLGGQAALAAALRFKSRRNVWPWFNTKRQVPAEYCPAIERATKGAVRCEELRPDVDWSVLRANPAVSPTPACGAQAPGATAPHQEPSHAAA